jgi:hypothetical protein
VRVGAVVAAVIEVRNEGTLGLTVQASVEGPNAAEFVIGNGASFVVAAGTSRGVEVRCSPASAGTKSATLRLASDDPDEPVVGVALTANAVEPIIAVTPPDRRFGDVRIDWYTTRVIWVRNDGSAPLAVTATGFTGPDASRFDVLRGGAPFAVAPGVTHEMEVRFRPGTLGPKAAILTIDSDDRRAPRVEVPLTGTGVAPEIAAAPGLEFGDVRVGGLVARTLDVRNEGTADLVVSAVEVEGADRTEFLLVGAGNFVVAPGAYRPIQVRWTPMTRGTKSASLRIVSGGAGHLREPAGSELGRRSRGDELGLDVHGAQRR